MQRSKPYPLRSLEVSFLVGVAGRKNGSPLSLPPPPSRFSFLFWFESRLVFATGSSFIAFHFTRTLIMHCLPVFACLLLHCCCSTGTSLLCAINRSAPYWLMVILLNLLCLLLQLLLEMKRYRPPNGINVALVTNTFSWVFPVALMIVAYMVEGNDAGTAFEILNKSRHSISCSMRFKNATEEFSLLWAHFTWICGGIVVVVILTLSELYESTRGMIRWRSLASAAVSAFSFLSSGPNNAYSTKADSSSTDSDRSLASANSLASAKSQNLRKLKGFVWRMVKLATSVAILQIVNLATRLQTLKTLDAWTASSNLWLKCKLKEDDFANQDWKLYGLEDGQEMCAVGRESWVRISECLTPCSYNATIDVLKLYTERVISPLLCEQKFEDVLVGYTSNCECTCDDMVQVRTPPTEQVMLSLVSQSMVVVIVGIIMGLRLQTLLICKCSNFDATPALLFDIVLLYVQ
jgi:hypothetical protein